ncbi:MAG: DNA polymerase III subunit alpha [Candidatus Altimarinota bacterium]
MTFVHLHNHTHFSILEGLPKPKDYVKKAKSLGMPAVAITDTNNIHGCHELYKYAKEEGIKPILGTEIYLQSVSDEKMFHKTVLLAKNYEGYKNIINLVSIANLERPGAKPYITWEELKNHSQNIICLSGPISGEIPYAILAGVSEEKIIARIQEYEDVFPGDFYVELLYHDDIPKQKLVTDTLIELHNKYNFKVVATNNCYYIDTSDKQTQDVIMALGTGHQIENPDRNTLINGDYSFFNEEQMQMLFGFLPSALSNTLEIASKIDIKIEIGGVLIPKYELPEEDQKIYEEAKELEKDESEIKKLTSDEWYLRYISFKGLNWRYNYNLSQQEIFNLVKKLDKPGLQKKLTESSPEELKELSLTFYSDSKKEFISGLDKDLIDKIDRLEYELVVVHEMGFDAYFLIVADYINWARNNGIPVGPGRGSAAGSLMAFLSGITDIDPLPYFLLFERFLNPARISMPDIDTDFADDGRDRVIEYCRNKYGADHVAQICTFGTFAARAAVKDVGRVMGVDFAEMNELAKLIPEKPGTKLKQALEESLEFKMAYEENDKYKNIIDNALKIEGNVRQIGVHACAVIIAPNKMTDYTALAHPPKDQNAIITQYSAYPLEDLGLLKMDFLGLRNLTIIKRALKIIKNNKGVDVNILTVPRDDPKVFEIFAAGDTTGVFQFESDGMRKYLIDLQPNSFEDLIAMVSLYRPGPLAYIPSYVERKHGREEVKYMADNLIEILKKSGYNDDEIAEEKRKLDEDLAPILDVSNGIAVYQEQLMFIVQVMAGFSLGEADLLRRGIGKKKIEIIEQLKGEFITRAGKYKNYKPETPKYIYEEMIQPAANYSFNKSHAACYAFIAYQTAYLKAYYRTEFLTALMVSDEESMERIVMEVGECNSKGINVLPPSINDSMKHFTYIDDSTIRFGLKAIKGIGDGPIEAIKNGRKEGKYISLEDFIARAGKEVINKKSLEALILSGSLDDFGERGQLFKNIETIIKYSRAGEKKKETNQIGLFDHIEDSNALSLETFPGFSFEESIKGEKLVIGFPISGHPLDGLSRYIEKRSQNAKILKMSFEEIENVPEKQKSRTTIVQAVGYVKDVRKMMTKSGGNMVFLYCESFEYDFEITIFPKDYETFKDKMEADRIIIVSGGLNINTEYKRKAILARDIKSLTLTQVREQAQSLGLFDNKKYNSFTKNDILKKSQTPELPETLPSNDEPQEETRKEDFVEIGETTAPTCAVFEEKIEKYIIQIPPVTQKENLLKLKEFMLGLPVGDIKIFLSLKGQEIDTKLSLAKLDEIYEFEKKYFLS